MNDRLYRSRDDRMIAGVAGGLAEHWGADPSVIRLVWAVLVVFTGGIALLVYIIMAFVVPEDPLGYGLPPVGSFAASPTPTPGSPDAAAELRAQRAGQLAEAREARRAARQGRRGDGGRSVALVFGGLLIVAGIWFLIDQYVPAFDSDWLWPLALVVLGAAVLVAAIRPASAPPTPMPPTGAAASGDADDQGATSGDGA